MEVPKETAKFSNVLKKLAVEFFRNAGVCPNVQAERFGKRRLN